MIWRNNKAPNFRIIKRNIYIYLSLFVQGYDQYRFNHNLRYCMVISGYYRRRYIWYWYQNPSCNNKSCLRRAKHILMKMDNFVGICNHRVVRSYRSSTYIIHHLSKPINQDLFNRKLTYLLAIFGYNRRRKMWYWYQKALCNNKSCIIMKMEYMAGIYKHRVILTQNISIYLSSFVQVY